MLEHGKPPETSVNLRKRAPTLWRLRDGRNNLPRRDRGGTRLAVSQRSGKQRESMAFLELDALSARYGKNTVVADLSLAAEKGEFLSILGPSGCGKTTTLRMIAGFVVPSAGAIRVAGRAIQDTPPHRRNIGYVFQNYALFPHLTVRENVAFGLRMRHVGKAAQSDRAAKALDLVGLGHLGDRYPAQLSGGQQQRVALARALVIEPDLLLLDEPLSNLDAALRGQMRSEIRALQRRLAITTVFVTHDQAEALAMSDRIAVMDHGRLVEASTPQALCDAPRHGFTAEFLGARTVVAGARAGGIFALPEGARCAVGADMPDNATRIVLRAARLHLSEGLRPARFMASGTVRDIAYLGDFCDVVVAAANTTIRVIRPSSEILPTVGAACFLSGDDDAVAWLAD
jgi:putative spermidine/putrescine transport system ATP-binding protein